VDRSWRNPNLIVWHGRVWAIDHGAALYHHHSWPGSAPDPVRFAALPFDATTHVLFDVARDVRDQHDALAARLTDEVIDGVLDAVPDEWMEPGADLPDAAANRAAYRTMIRARLATPDTWLESAP